MIRRILLCLPLMTVLCGAMMSTAQAAMINVTTLNDEDGENSNACSLREAIKASERKVAYGGCPAGQQYYTDTIQLQSGTYQLSRGELVVNGSMLFVGAYAINLFEPDAITGQPVKRTAITTTIAADTSAPGHRIFNTSFSHADLNLLGINLVGGREQNGGAILAGGTLELTRVNISGATATEQGGAVFLEGDLANITANSTTFTNNNAPRGAVLGMSCYDNLKYTARSITMAQLSISNNGKAVSSESILDFCGLPTVTLTASTIAQNDTTLNTNDANTAGPAATIRMVDNAAVTRLSTKSSMTLVSNTVTENTTATGFLFGNMATLVISNNILAYNTPTPPPAGQPDSQYFDCHYYGKRDDNGNPLKTVRGTNNLFATKGTPGGVQSASTCRLYDTTNSDDPVKSSDSNVYASSSQQLSSFVSPFGSYGSTDPNYVGYLPLAGKGLIGKGALTSVCGSNDQRGLPRGSSSHVSISADGIVTENIPCDIGAMDLSQLMANDNQGGGNTSYVITANGVTDTTGLTPDQAAVLTQQNIDYRKAYKDTYRYREAVLDVIKNDFADELVSGNSSTIPLLAAPQVPKGFTSPYVVTAEPDVGNIHCEWNSVMMQLLATRKDGSTTPGGQHDSCKYTITDTRNGKKSTATVYFTITNTPPIVVDQTVTLPFGALSVDLNILQGASDDGDGPTTSLGYPANKPAFYQDVRMVNGVKVTIPANIILLTKPTQGHIVAEFSEPCVNNNVNTTQNTCLGGKITYVNDNTFSPFNDSFTYQVLDADFAPSNIGQIRIINTATTTDQAKAGGGSLGLGALFGLSALALVRRRALKAKSI
jgi:CSLREA domain-containing protein